MVEKSKGEQNFKTHGKHTTEHIIANGYLPMIRAELSSWTAAVN